MKRIFTILIGLCFCAISIAQESPMMDSLKIKLQQSKDTTKAKLAFEIAKYYVYYHSSMDSIMAYSALGLKYSEQYGFDRGKDRYQFLLGQMYWQNQDYGAALRAFEETQKIVTEKDDQYALSMVYNAKGAIYAAMEDYENANENYIKAIQIGEAAGLTKELAATYSNLSIVNTRGRHLERSLLYDQKALSVLQENLGQEDSLVLVTVLLNTASSLKNLDKLDSARIYNKRAIDLATYMNYDRGIKRAFNSRMVIELEAKNHKQVLAYADRL
ncbi:MAG: tetratricopeptide repeat protein, partial [Bacteroidota bacterium]